jgi:hypothetical protein
LGAAAVFGTRKLFFKPADFIRSIEQQGLEFLILDFQPCYLRVSHSHVILEVGNVCLCL